MLRLTLSRIYKCSQIVEVSVHFCYLRLKVIYRQDPFKIITMNIRLRKQDFYNHLIRCFYYYLNN